MRAYLWILSFSCVFGNLRAHEEVMPSEETVQMQEEIGQPKVVATEKCDDQRSRMRFGIRHIEGNGIGYNQGYSTLELFLSNPYAGILQPFVDLRGHIFNDGYYALNAGLGVRGICDERVYGGTVYYDGRKTEGQYYNQVGLGFETLGTFWDVRVNGYIPVGPNGSYVYNLNKGFFKGNSLFVPGRKELPLFGCHAEVAFHYKTDYDLEVYPAIGPYYFGAEGKNVGGGQLRVALKYSDYIALEGSFSYDNVFRDIYQGQVAFSFPFGSKKVMQKKSSSMSCRTFRDINDLMIQPVIREEIVVLTKKHRNQLAINPATGLPWNFLFVDNTSHSAGTFESPYSTLETAIAASLPNDVIYIFPGDGTSSGLNAGPYVLQDNQQLLGAGTAQAVASQLGTVTILANASGLPLLTAASNTPVITVVNGNTISGLQVAAFGGTTSYAIGSSSGTAQGLTVTNNLLQISSLAYGIFPNNMGGNIIISNNTITSPDTAGSNAVNIVQANVIASSVISNNTISGFGSSGLQSIVYSGTGTSSISVLIDSNQMATDSSVSNIYITNYNSVVMDQTISNNTFTSGAYIISSRSFNSATVTSSILNNIGTNVANGLSIIPHDLSSMNLNVVNNEIVNTSNYGLYSSVNETSSLCANIESNQFINNSSWLIEMYSPETTSLTIASNAFSIVPSHAVEILTHTGAACCLNLIDNTCSSGQGYRLTGTASSALNIASYTGNTGTVTVVGTVGFVPAGTCETCFD